MERACAVADVHGAPDAPLPSDRRRVGSADVARRPSFASRNDPVAEAPIALGLEHVWLVAPSVLLSASIGVLLGVLTHRSATARSAVIAVTGAFLTIPSFALLLLLLGIVSLGTAPVVIALTMYGLLPVVRDTSPGYGRSIPRSWSLLSAWGCSDGSGCCPSRCIELLLAWPVVLAVRRPTAGVLDGRHESAHVRDADRTGGLQWPALSIVSGRVEGRSASKNPDTNGVGALQGA